MKIGSFFHWAVTVGLLSFFLGCGPQYVIQNQYIPPTTSQGQECLNLCSSSRKECQIRCQKNYQICLDGAYGRAQVIEKDEQRSYEHAMDRYRFEMIHFEHAFHRWQRDYYEYSRDFTHFSTLCERTKDLQACKKRDELSRFLSRFNHERPREPLLPVRLSFEQIVLNQQSYCTKECGCDQGYDSCFVGCGGEVIPHKICIKNCE